MATIYDVSVLAGVSLATVSRVMNKNAKVSEKTEKKVLDAMAQLGYRPNAIAQSLASNCSNSVGVLVSELRGHFYGSMMSGIEAEFRIAHKHVIIAAGHSEEQLEKEGIEFLISRRCDALILHVEAVSDEYLIELCKGSIPVILINRYIEQIEDRCVHLNNELGGYIATKAVIDQGHRDIAYIAGPYWKEDAQNRLHGHKRALAEHGLTFHEQLVFEGDYREESGAKGFRALHDTNFPFSALVCANDEMASGAMDAVRGKGLSMPNDMSVMGFDNNVLANYMFPKLSSVDYPIAEMGHMAAKMVLKQCYQSPQTNLNNIFDPKLVLRDSISLR
ncbi:LacI family DNA-binding transcriptional regulator [Shewanella waksmanii]|uniref:LacI family DNA-binding transcriptional regulator n=1 Tax=Shewanella waksmanii TaxID=213783 RepID=UPI00048AA0F6|nr:LacI family DNA-binding transcriptional regulator [Shewanella waksmanii]